MSLYKVVLSSNTGAVEEHQFNALKPVRLWIEKKTEAYLPWQLLQKIVTQNAYSRFEVGNHIVEISLPQQQEFKF